jgi:hypothetical protein
VSNTFRVLWLPFNIIDFTFSDQITLHRKLEKEEDEELLNDGEIASLCTRSYLLFVFSPNRINANVCYYHCYYYIDLISGYNSE